MSDCIGVLPGLPAVAGKPVGRVFDAERLTSDGRVLLGAIERQLGIAKRLAGCIEDPSEPAAVRHSIAEMIRFRALLIAARYPDAKDCDALRHDPAFKMVLGRLPESGSALCSQPAVKTAEESGRPDCA